MALGARMSSISPSPDEQGVKHIRQFLAWVTPVTFGFAALFSAIFLLFGDIWVAVQALATFGAACAMLQARVWAERGQIQRAVGLICMSLLAADLLAAATKPVSPPTLMSLPLLAFAVALPYVGGQALRRLLALCWLTAACVAVLVEIVELHAVLPPWLLIALRVALIMALVSTVLLLLWQFSNRLAGTLAEMRAANAELRESELRYRMITEITADVIYSLRVDDSGETILEWTSESFAATMGGYTADEMLRYSDWIQVLHPDDRTIEALHSAAVMAGKPDVAEYRIVNKSGEVRWLRDYARPEWDAPRGRVVRILAAATDITDLKRAEESLRESRALLQLVADVVPVLIAYVDAQQRYRFVNRGYVEWFGRPANQIIGGTMRDLLGEQSFATIERYVDAALAGQQVVFEMTALDSAGVPHDFRRIYIPDKSESGETLGFVAMVQDVTERRQAEEQRLALERKMLETQKLESIGVLAGGIAHDFNNLLTAMLGNASLALIDLPADSSARESIARIARAAEQAADLTRQMLAYSGQGRFLIQPLNLNMIIAESRSLIEASIGKSVTLRYDLADALPDVEADVAQIRQMLMNLVLNAAEAIDDQGGVVELHTAVVEAEQASFDQFDLAPDQAAPEYVLLRVSDTGCGMDAAIRARMFDPFFSTKFTGRGLGLAAVLGIVRAHHGGLRVQSELGRGTIFAVLLPSVRKAPERADVSPPSEQPAQAPAAAATTILVVDDDPAVRAVAARMLERLDCAVLQAADGRAAIELFQAYRETITLVLLDLTMPQLSGEQVLSELQQLRPGTPVVVMSGYTIDEAARRFSGLTPAGFLQKPFTPADLRKALRGAIEQPDE
jgi:PAS domain S-box-containing protein